MTDTDLARIAVRLNDYDDPDHVEICLEPGARDDTDAQLATDLEWWRAMTHVAGILGRLGAVLAPFVAFSAHRHGCGRDDWTPPGPSMEDNPPHSYDGCGIASKSLLRPHWDEGPDLWLTVPRREAKPFLARINEALKTIADEANAMAALDLLGDHDEAAWATGAASVHVDSKSNLGDTSTITHEAAS